MLRANLNRLFRKTWNTTKKLERLNYHLAIYSWYHNFKLILKRKKKNSIQENCEYLLTPFEKLISCFESK